MPLPLVTPLSGLTQAGCRLVSPHATAFHLLAPPPLIAPLPLLPLVWLITVSSILTLPHHISWRLRLSLLHCLSSCPFRASHPAGCHVSPLLTPTPPIYQPPPIILPSPLITPRSVLSSGWLLHRLFLCQHPSASASASHHAAFSCHTPLGPHSGWLYPSLSSRRCLPSAGASTSHHAVASCHAPLRPHSGWLSPSLSSRHRLPSAGANASPVFSLAGYHVLYPHAAPSYLLAPPPLIASLSIIVPLSGISSGWLSRLPTPHADTSHLPASAYHLAVASYHAPLGPLIWLVVASPLLMPAPPSFGSFRNIRIPT